VITETSSEQEPEVELNPQITEPPDEEHRKFGQEGFEGMVDKVAGLEKTLGIYDLKQFTPR